MGACEFTAEASGATAQDAFEAAREHYLYECGHGGYTGTIAEKNSFVMIDAEGKDPRELAWDLIERDDPRISDKWGPAGCIKVSEERYLFFGWASS